MRIPVPSSPTRMVGRRGPAHDHCTAVATAVAALAALFLAALPLPAAAQASEPSARAATPVSTEPQKLATIAGVTEYLLPNGLRVLTSRDRSQPTVTMNLVYQVGSRHEGAGEAGMAHLLEHMLFKGTEATPDPKREFSRRGMRWNATTSYDRTNYFARFNHDVDHAAWLLGWFADTMSNVRIDAEKLDSERPVVRNEMQASENRPQQLLYQQLMSTAYDFHSYGRAVIGNVSDLANVRPQRLQAFYERYYRPDNAVLIVTGAFDEAETMAMVAGTLGKVPRPASELAHPYTLDRAQQGEREVALRRAGGVPMLAVGYHMMPGSAREAVAFSVLCVMLTRQPDGPLYEALVKEGLAVSIYGYPVGLHDPGVVVFGAMLDASHDRAAAWAKLQTLLEEELPLSQESLERTKLDFANSHRAMMESPESLGWGLTEAVALGDWRLLFAQADWTQAVTLEEIETVARKYLLQSNRTLAWYLPSESPRRAPDPARVDVAKLLEDHPWQQAPDVEADYPLDAKSIEAHAVTGRLETGQAYAILPRRTRGDRVSVALRLQWGDLQSLRGRWKDADMLDRMMLTATRELTLQALEDRLRPLDARMDVAASEIGAELTMQVPRQHLEAALAIAVQALREPEFPADVYEERKRRLVANIRSRQDQPESIVSDALRRAGFPYPPEDPRHYRPPEERIADLQAHTVERMKAFYRDFAGASRAQLAVVGDVEPQAIISWLGQALGDWKSPQPWERIVRPFHPLPSDRRLQSVPDKPNAVYLQARAVPVGEDDPDYIPLALAMRIFGADSDSRVSRRLREQESLTYGAYALLSSDREVSSGMVSIRAIHAPGNVGRVEQAIDEEIERALREGFTQDELDAARNAWVDRRLQVLADEGSVASILASNLYWDDTMQRWMDRDERIRTLTLDEVNAAFRKHVKPGEALVLGAGDYD